MKSFLKSKTVWLAVAQGVSGIMVAFLATDPTLSGVGWFLLLKSGVDVFFRFITTTEIH